jgi:(p)ppGpp synthase/HD superfamily hydrolase
MKAERIARLLHAGQWYIDDRVPYINHVEGVVEAVEGADRDVAWLHDVLEDTEVTSNELLDLGVSHETLEAVIVLTRDPSGKETYAEYIDRIAKSCNPSAIRVKIADLNFNLSWAVHYSKGTLVKRYKTALAKLEELI